TLLLRPVRLYPSAQNSSVGSRCLVRTNHHLPPSTPPPSCRRASNGRHGLEE
ncbi:hypothetical protein B0H10DRAFT_2014123, partial [Mycena sp. CBHHK59/15]